MRESMNHTKRRMALGGGLFLSAVLGCHNFDTAYDDCKTGLRCLDYVAPPIQKDGIFVDPVAGVDGESAGSRDAPYQSLAEALKSTKNLTDFYLATGEFKTPGGLQLSRPVAIHGGYSGKSGSWGPSNATSMLSGGPIALTNNAVAGKAASMGLLKGSDTNIQQYVTAKALDGLYLMIGEEERKIRQDPVGTGSAISARCSGRAVNTSEVQGQ